MSDLAGAAPASTSDRAHAGPASTPDLAHADGGRAATDLRLELPDTGTIDRLARALCDREPGRVDAPEWVAEARRACGELPLALRRELREFRRDAGPHGTLLVHGLPVDGETLGVTPSAADSVQRDATVPAAVLLMVACALGDPVAYRAEKSGALVQDVVPVPGREAFSGNAGSALLTFHNENAFHVHEPDYLLLLCLRADHDQRAGLRTACLREVLPLLGEAGREALFAPEFVTAPPPSFADDGAERAPQPLLFGEPEDPDMRMATIATTPLTERATAALRELGEAFETACRTVVLAPGDMAILDNRVTVHGRTPFTPRYDGADRWVQRTFVIADLRRSRDHRPLDGYVIEAGPARARRL